MEKVEEQVLHLRSQVVVELESRAARNQQRLTQLQAELALEREEHEGASKAILECIMGALHALADHKEEVKRRLGRFRGGEGGREGGRVEYEGASKALVLLLTYFSLSFHPLPLLSPHITTEEFREQCLQKRDHLSSLPEPFSVQ